MRVASLNQTGSTEVTGGSWRKPNKVWFIKGEI